MPDNEDELDELVRQVQKAEKYAHISPQLIRSILARELIKRRNSREAVKTTRNKLHQVGAAFQERPLPYLKWQKELGALPASLEDPGVTELLQKAMAAHASTRERIPILSRFFIETLREVSPLHSILDLACGLNPLAISFMPIAQKFNYFACDIYEDMTAFLNFFFTHFGIEGKAQICDLTQNIPTEKTDLALVLKTIPCLEQVDKEIGFNLLSQLQASNILVSFPAKSLGGRSKGMVQNYDKHFQELIAGQSWKITRFEFPGELAFLVMK